MAARPIPTEIPGVAELQADLLWQSHGEKPSGLSTAQVRTRVMDYLALLGATEREAENVLARIEQHLRDNAPPADTRPSARRRPFQTEERDPFGVDDANASH
jgi:hypothetical protein